MDGSVPSTRAIAKVFLVVVGLALACYLAWAIRDVVKIVAFAGFIAIALGPAVEFVHRRKLPRALSILLVYVFILLAIFGVGLLVVPPIVDQVGGLSQDLPRYYEDIRQNDTFRSFDEKYHITQELTAQAEKLPSKLGTAATELQSVTIGVFSFGVDTIAVLTIAFLLLLDGKRLLAFLYEAIGVERAARLRPLADQMYRAVSGYVLGNFLISLLAGLMTYLTLTILGVPFAVPLAVLVAFLDLVPLVGATIGGIIVGVVTLFTDFPTATIVWVAVLVAYQQAENHLLQPIIYRRTVNVRPIVVIVSILIGAALLGVLGALVAIPVAAAVQILLRDWWQRRSPDVPPEQFALRAPPDDPPPPASPSDASPEPRPAT